MTVAFSECPNNSGILSVIAGLKITLKMTQFISLNREILSSMEVQSIQHYLQSNGWEHKRPNWQSIESESPGVCNSSAVVVVSSQLPFVKPSLSSPMHLSQSMRAITRGSRQAVCLSACPWRSLSHLGLQRVGTRLCEAAERPTQHWVMLHKSLLGPGGWYHLYTTQLYVANTTQSQGEWCWCWNRGQLHLKQN